VTLALDSVRTRSREQLRVLNPRIIGLFVAIVVAAAIFQIYNHNFLTVANALSLAQSMSALVILSMGLTFVILAGEIDLSVGSVFGLAPMATALLWVHGTPMVLSVLIGLALGCAIGLINGFIVTRFDIPSFIVTLGTMNIVFGITLLISHASSVDPKYPTSGKAVPHGQYQLFLRLPPPRHRRQRGVRSYGAHQRAPLSADRLHARWLVCCTRGHLGVLVPRFDRSQCRPEFAVPGVRVGDCRRHQHERRRRYDRRHHHRCGTPVRP
jgi:hypothetical protein